MPPKVQTIAQVMADLAPAYDPMREITKKRQAGLGDKYDAQRAGIYAERGEGFNAINNQMTGRGLSFGGIGADEQARYLSTKFLPGLQMADYQQNEEDLALQGDIAELDKEARLQAQSAIERQQNSLTEWNRMMAQQEFQSRENRLDREARSAESAANRAFSASQSAQTGPTTSQVTSHMNDWASKRWGGDKRLSPSDFKAGYQEFFSYAGGSVDDYVAIMQRYVNNSHAKDYAF